MDKHEYKKAYRIARLLIHCGYGREHHKRKVRLHKRMEEITSDPILQTWIPTNAIQKNYCMETAFHQYRPMYFISRSREWNREQNIRRFKLLLNDVYGAIKREIWK